MRILRLLRVSGFSALLLVVFASACFDCAHAAIICVSLNSSANGPGSNWSSAYQSIASAIAASSSGDEIWVRSGTYAESVTLKLGVALYGGFAGDETARDDRNWVENPTVIDGSGRDKVVTIPLTATYATRLDGFTIRNGSDQGVFCIFSSPSIANNTILGNVNYGINCSYSSASITNNRISGSERAINCLSSSPSITNNIVSGNGTGISCDNSSGSITNNTVSGNGIGIACVSSSCSITNNIAAFNLRGLENDGNTLEVMNNCVYNPDGADYYGLGAGVGDINADPKFQSADYGRLHIQPDSPCVDAGLDSAVANGWADMDGQARHQGAHVDIGADECDGTIWPAVVSVVRVGPAGNDANDGSTWALAKRTVQAGLDALSVVGGEVWVMAGVYAQTVKLPVYTHLYGGFSGVEMARRQRDYRANSTALVGEGYNNTITVLNGYRVNTVDGFTVREGHTGISCSSSSPIITNNTITLNTSSGISCLAFSRSSPLISNNTISKNGNYGISCSSSSAVIAKNSIVENRIAIFCASSSASIKNNTISRNSAGVNCTSSASSLIANNAIAENGSYGISCSSSSPAIANNTITKNALGILCEDASWPAITNNTILENTSGGIYCKSSSSPSIANNIVAFGSIGISSIDTSYPSMMKNCVHNPNGTNYVGLAAGAGDISADPLFVDRANANYRLRSDSPCVDAGMDGAWQPGWLDMDGQPRRYGVVDIGADEYWPILEASLGECKTVPDAVDVRVNGLVVSAVFANVFYGQTPDRSAGIRVEMFGHGRSVGQAISVVGAMATNSDGERFISPRALINSGNGFVAPVTMTNRSLGGASAVGGQSGVKYGRGLNNIGLLVRTSGKVTSVNAQDGYFTMSDTTQWGEQPLADADGAPGVRVLTGSGAVPAVGEWVIVTGISSCYSTGDGLYPLLRARDAGSIVPQ